MAVPLKNQSWLQDPQLQAMMAHFAAHGEELRFVGGCVRDALLGLSVHDVDMATTALPEKTLALLAELHIKTLPTGLAHGTITAMFGGWQVEITSLRRDVACDGRHAEVAFGRDWEADACRRDFTINALYCDAEGKISDYHHGLADIKAGRVRFIGDPAQRIAEDGLRILRFFRFWSRFSKTHADSAALAACADHALMLEGLSAERIHKEMTLLLETPRAEAALRLMRSALLENSVWGTTLALEVLHWLRLLEQELGAAPDWTLAASALLSHMPRQTPPIITRWKCSKKQASTLKQLLGAPPVASMDFITAKTTIRHAGREVFSQIVLLQWAMEASEYQTTACPHADVYRSMLALARSWVVPDFPVTGEDLLAIGMEAGKPLGQTLKRLEQRWEHSDFSLSKEALLKAIAASGCA
jgi:poly(A) polymerase